MVASEYHFTQRYDEAIEVLRHITGDPAIEASYRRAAFGMLAGVYVEAGLVDEAKSAIAQLLDFEPPLIIPFPSNEHREVQEVYEEVRRERIGNMLDTTTVQTLAVYPFRSLYLADSLAAPFDAWGPGLSSLLINALAGHGITLVEREHFLTVLEDTQADAPVDRGEDNPFTIDPIMQLTVPWVILDESQLQGRFIPATHVLFGSYMVRNQSPDLQEAEILVSVWIYNSKTAQLRAAEQVRGPISQLDNRLNQLTNRIVARIGR